MSLGTYALITLADLEEYANITITDHEPLLERLIDAATGLFETYTRRKLKARGFSYDSDSDDYDPDNAILDGTGTDELALPQYPINSVATLRINETAIDARASLYNYGYVIDKAGGILRLTGYLFSKGMANIELAYNAGLSAIPDDLQQACIEQVVWMYKQSAVGGNLLGMAEKNLPDGTTSYAIRGLEYTGSGLLPEVKAKIDQYKKYYIG